MLTGTTTTPIYGYDFFNRLVSYSSGSNAGSYVCNGRGERVQKTANGVTTFFVYDEAGHIIGEYNGPTAIEETVYLGDMPVSVVEPAGTFFVHADYRNVPRQIDNAKKQAVWAWDPEVFGDTNPDQNPPGTPATTFVYNLRFPGQYYDAESGNFYNKARDYSPTLGRYLESDSFGLVAGVNTYAYTGGNPLAATDPSGNFGLAGAVVGGILGGLIDFLYQLYHYHGNLSCVHGGQVLAAAGSGALVGFTGGLAADAAVAAMESAVAADAVVTADVAIASAVTDAEAGLSGFSYADAAGLDSASAADAAAASDASSSLQAVRLSQQLSAEEAAGSSAPSSITSWSDHALEQIAGRDGGVGVSQTALEDAFANPNSIQYAPSAYGPTFRYVGSNATVVVNAEGNVVTGWATNSLGIGP